MALFIPAFLEYVIYLNTDFSGKISFDIIPNTEELAMIEPSSKGAVIDFSLTQSGIEYRVPLFSDFPIFPFYRKYSSEFMPPNLEPKSSE